MTGAKSLGGFLRPLARRTGLEPTDSLMTEPMDQKKLPILSQLNFLRAQRPQLLWSSLALAIVSGFGMVAAFATAPTTAEIESVSQPVLVELPRPAIEGSALDGRPFVREERLSRSDTFAALARRLAISDPAAMQFIVDDPVARKIYAELRPGKVITASTLPNGRLQTLSFPLNDNAHAIAIDRIGDGFQARKVALEIESRTEHKSGEIRSSFFAAADAADLPDAVAMQLVSVFDGEVDFHRDLRRGDRFLVVYEAGWHKGRMVRSGRILAAEFTVGGKTHRAIWFNDGSENGNYYTPEGRSLRASFFRSPIEFSRITSGFAMRFHPILQEWRAHRGVDYGAPTGTPVRATADGVVEEVGRQNGYGNLVVLRHGSRYSTLYGHLNGFAGGLRRGARVQQGEVIGFVGQTGMATGPHLHYEFRIDDVQVDPTRLALPSHSVLDGAQLAAFRATVSGHVLRLDRLRGPQLAQAD